MKRLIYRVVLVVLVPSYFILALVFYGEIRHHIYDKPIIKFCNDTELGVSYEETVLRAKKLDVANLSESLKSKGKFFLHSKRIIMGGYCEMSFQKNILISAKYWWPN